MIIHKPKIIEDETSVTISAKIEVENPLSGFPEFLFYKFPKGYKDFITDRVDGFAVSLLPLAMQLGEDLEIRGSLSSRLAKGMREYQLVQSTWKPAFFKLVDVKYDELISTLGESNQGSVGSSFSGGVDSFHTLLTHLPQNEPNQDYIISHCLIINGFEKDPDIESFAEFQKKQQVYEPMMAANNLDFLVSCTNLRQFIGNELLKQSFAACITASALILGRLFSRFYIPSSYKFTSMGTFPDGSHLMLDNLLSTESLQIIHDGAHFSRVEKTTDIAQWSETHSTLRVCFGGAEYQEQSNTIENCCKCEKCIRTMITLDLCGALQKYSTFPRPLKRQKIRNAYYNYKGSRLFAKEVLEYAKEIGRKDIVFDLRYALIRSIIWLKPLIFIFDLSARLKEHSETYCRFVRFVKRTA